MEDRLIRAMADLEEEIVLKLVQERFNANLDPLGILTTCREGLTLVGQRYESGEYYVSELIMAGEIFKQINAILSLGGTTESEPCRGKIVFGTVKGDIHNIGKDLVVGMLRTAGYEVTDLGVDVPVERFLEAVSDTGAKIVGLSGLLTVAFDSMKAVVEALESARLRPGVKVMIGGGSITEAVLKYTGADVFGLDAQDAVNFANQWIFEQDSE